MGDEEGYICRWDPAAGRGAIRASRTPGVDLPFEAADLRLAPQAPRLGMAVVFQRVAVPQTVQSGKPSDRAIAIRPWASVQGALTAASGRRARRPVFQATGAASLTPAEDPLAGARTALIGREAAPLNGITRPSPLPDASMRGSSRPFHPTPAWPGALALAAYGALLAAGTLRGRGPLVLAAIAPLLWLASFAAYWHDKHGARTRSTADRDATLHVIDALGGWPGGWLAMRLLPHKRQRPAFRLRFWVIAGLHSVALGIALHLQPSWR